jgi:O-antigen polymerase
MGVVTALFLVFELFSGDDMVLDIKSMPVILAAIYTILMILSTLFSKHISVALMGATERYEGLFVWLSYMVFFITAISFSSKINRAKFILWAFILSGFLLGVIGVLQTFNIPIYETKFVSKLVMGSHYQGNNLKLKFDSVFATLYNPNCAGVYFGMIASLSTVLSVCLPVKTKEKYASILVAVLTLISTVGSSSVGGFLGLICGLGFTFVVALCYFVFKKKKPLAIAGSCIAVIAVIIATIVFLNSDSVTAQKIRIIYNAVSSGQSMDSSNNYYKDFNINGNKGNVITADGTFTVVADRENSELFLNDRKLTPVKTEPYSNSNGKHLTFNENNLKWELYAYSENKEDGTESPLFRVTLIATDALNNEKFFMFGQKNDGNLEFLDSFGNVIDLDEEISKWGFEGIERLGSNRGYIWSRSIPLLAHNIIIGSGPDTYEFEFPQHDARAKLNYLNNPYVILDKPHNMYLQYGICTGVLSLIVLLVLFCLYIVQTVKEIFKESDSYNIALKLAILAGIISYLASGMTTDSVVSVAPVFWTLLGMGFGVNLIGKVIKTNEERKLEKLRKKLK